MQEAPNEFNQQFLMWLRELEQRLLVKLADWHPSPVEQVQEYAGIINQHVPRDLEIYYASAYPFGLLRDGWRKWKQRREEYQVAWMYSLVNMLGIELNEAEVLVSTSPVLWPIDCLGEKRDVAGFVQKNGELAVIELDLQAGGKGKPIASGLRNYFLVCIALELLAEDLVEVNFDELAQHPTVFQISGWPKESSPEHIALTVNQSLAL
jgi:hypothetical protein